MVNYSRQPSPTPVLNEPALNASAVESLLRGLGLHENQAVLNEIKVLFNFDYRKDSKVKVSQLYEIGKFFARRYYPDVPLEKAFFDISYRSMYTFRDTVLGKVALAGLNVVSASYALKLLPKIMSSNVNYGSRRIEKITRNYWEFTFEEDPGEPNSTAGMVKALMEMINLKNPNVEVVIIGKQAYKLILTFSE